MVLHDVDSLHVRKTETANMSGAPSVLCTYNCSQYGLPVGIAVVELHFVFALAATDQCDFVIIYVVFSFIKKVTF